LDAVYWQESSHLLEERSPTSMLKNAGLGHLHIAQNKLIPSDGPMPMVTSDLFNTLDRMKWPTEKCKEWSAERFRTLWGLFLDREDASADSQYPAILQMYETATKKK
jgi:hypothetical protein